jgi:hypothetical protein
MVEYTTIGQATPETEGEDEEPAEQSPLPAEHNDTEVDDDIDEDNLDADHDDDTSLRFRNINDILRTARFAPRALVAKELHVVSSDKSASLVEAEHSPNWRNAMIEEMTSIEENDTKSLVDLPPGHKAIGVKWEFKVKRDEHGVVSKHKERLMVKGYTQRHDIDYDEVFTPAARLDSVRLLIVVTVHEAWEVHRMNVKSTFLNNDLQDEVYVEQLVGFIVTGMEHEVLKLWKALYGLHHAPRTWNVKLDDMLLSLGFQRTPSEHTIYV